MNALKQLRQKAGLTQQELNDLSGVHFTTILDIEKNRTAPKPETVKRLAKALKVHVSEITKRKYVSNHVSRPKHKIYQRKAIFFNPNTVRHLDTLKERIEGIFGTKISYNRLVRSLSINKDYLKQNYVDHLAEKLEQV